MLLGRGKASFSPSLTIRSIIFFAFEAGLGVRLVKKVRIVFFVAR
jgi:hypothetical protein